MSELLGHTKALRALAKAYDAQADIAAQGHPHDVVNALRIHARAHRAAADDLEEQAKAGTTAEAGTKWRPLAGDKRKV